MLNKDGMCELIGIKYIDLDCSKFPEIQVKISITTLEIIEKIGRLITLYNNQNNKEIVQLMKTIVPEFISNNSEFSQLDEKQTNSF